MNQLTLRAVVGDIILISASTRAIPRVARAAYRYFDDALKRTRCAYPMQGDIPMAPFPSPAFAKIALLQDIRDPGWVTAGPDPPGPLQASKAPIHYMLTAADLNDGEPCPVGEGIAPATVGAPVAEVLPRSYAPPATERYGPVAPAWVQRHPRMIFAWAWLRALRWVLRDVWRAFIS